jgi:hypothetical protein
LSLSILTIVYVPEATDARVATSITDYIGFAENALIGADFHVWHKSFGAGHMMDAISSSALNSQLCYELSEV